MLSQGRANARHAPTGNMKLSQVTDLERTILVRIAIASLPERDRETVLALYYEDLTEAEAGRRIGLTKGAIYMRMVKIKRRLRSRIEKLSRELA